VHFDLGGDCGAGGIDDYGFHYASGYDLRSDFASLAPGTSIVKDMTARDADLRAKVDQLIAEQRKAKEVGDTWRD